jgi:hypothetical protein
MYEHALGGPTERPATSNGKGLPSGETMPERDSLRDRLRCRSRLARRFALTALIGFVRRGKGFHPESSQGSTLPCRAGVTGQPVHPGSSASSRTRGRTAIAPKYAREGGGMSNRGMAIEPSHSVGGSRRTGIG